MTVALLVIALVVGVALGWLAARLRSTGDLARLEATLRATREGEERLAQSLRAVGQENSRDQHESLARLLRPLQDTIDRYERRIIELEADRVDAYAELRTQVGQMHGVSESLRTETAQLVAALRAPQVRGRWGEHQLRRIVEAAGMLAHCDFDEQVSARVDDRPVRPDLVVQLSGGRSVVVDAKAPFEAYLSAMEARDERGRNEHLDMHAKHLRAHVEQLAAKNYWQAFEQTPEFVVLFIPADPFLDAALQRDATLLEYAFARDVVLATPATLVALLRTVAYTWRQDALASNALAVHRLGRELYNRLSTMAVHFAKVGTSLGGAVTAYNRAVGSLESRVLVSARKFAELGISHQDIPAPVPLDLAPREPQPPTNDDPPEDDPHVILGLSLPSEPL